ncbi:hypothetical protein FS837_009051 [Tulasnella sp. UAMH 9824]|nr:hypothetical protein FS837_009051 [Tulasnella sp. UAMH 9824]
MNSRTDILDMPTERFVLTHSKLGEKYGPITWLVVPGRTIIVLNTYDAMYEILERRGNKYMDRPRAAMIQDLVGMDFITALRQGDPIWRLHRKLLRPALSLDTIKRNYSDLFIAGAHRFLDCLVHKPETFRAGLKRSLGEMISNLTYGAHKDDQGNDYVAKNEELLEYSTLASAGYLVDLFPLLKHVPSWFPGAQFQRDAASWRKHMTDLRNLMIDGIQKRMAAGEGRSCYVRNTLEELQKHKDETGADVTEDIQALYDSAFSFYQAAADTTEITLKNFLLAMTLFPEVQARARQEIDRIVGNRRFPDFGDQGDMPYIYAVVLESLRWNPPAPFIVPHASREDDTYNGYFIPKGTMVIPNVWQISRDPAVYEDASTFNPDRFINNPKILDPRDFVFGFGRRSCPGNYMAYQMIWIFVVSTLWGFELERPEGEPPLDNDADRFDFGFLSYPNPFGCNFIPRKDAMSKMMVPAE